MKKLIIPLSVTGTLIYKFLSFYDNLQGNVSNIIVRFDTIDWKKNGESIETTSNLTYSDLKDFYDKMNLAGARYTNLYEFDYDRFSLIFVKLISFDYTKNGVLHKIYIDDNNIKNDFDLINLNDYLKLHNKYIDSILVDGFDVEESAYIVNNMLVDLKYLPMF